MTERSFQLIAVGENVFRFEVMIYGGVLQDLQPMVVLHSIEFAMPPSIAFCEQLWSAGYQVIFVRRAGYGQSSPLPAVLLNDQPVRNGATAAAEAAMLRQLITRLDLTDPVLLAVGSANPVAYRLVRMAPEICYSVLVNPVFNQDIWQVFSPPWFEKMLRQIIASRSGLSVAAQGVKMMLRNDPIAFYKHILQKNPGDIDYVDINRSDYAEAAAFSQNTTAGQLYYESMMCLTADPLLKDGYFDDLRVSVLIGENSTEYWRTEMQGEADRLGTPVALAPQGDIFCAYASPQSVVDLLQAHARQAVLDGNGTDAASVAGTH